MCRREDVYNDDGATYNAGTAVIYIPHHTCFWNLHSDRHCPLPANSVPATNRRHAMQSMQLFEETIKGMKPDLRDLFNVNTVWQGNPIAFQS